MPKRLNSLNTPIFKVTQIAKSPRPATGAVLQFHQLSTHCLNIPLEWSNRISSVNTQSECIFAYEQRNCQGKWSRFAPGTPSYYNLTEIDFNDKISSTTACTSATEQLSTSRTTTANKRRAIEQASLEEHNIRRRRHSSSNLVGNFTLHQQAQKWAQYLADNNKFEHSQTKGMGENLAANQAKDEDTAVRRALVQWYDNEEPKYNYSRPGFSRETGHFTQVVWRSSTQLGVGIAWNPTRRWWVVVANYSPAGNVVGQFEKNVVPPK